MVPDAAGLVPEPDAAIAVGMVMMLLLPTSAAAVISKYAWLGLAHSKPYVRWVGGWVQIENVNKVRRRSLRPRYAV